MSNTLERFGRIIKKEALVTMEEQILPHSFVLEAPEPFPGYFAYYSEIPIDTPPFYIYLVPDKFYSLEEILRATQNIQEYVDFNFEAACGVIDIYTDKFPIIRIRELDEYSLIPKLQSCYQDEGIVMHRKPGRRIKATGLISLDKFFFLMPQNGDLFLDGEKSDHGYFEIPCKLKWQLFEELTKRVRYNWELSHFDVAFGFFFQGYHVHDMVRIYHPDITTDFLSKVRDLFLYKLKEFC